MAVFQNLPLPSSYPSKNSVYARVFPNCRTGTLRKGSVGLFHSILFIVFKDFIEKNVYFQLVAGWMKMRPAQRLKFLDSENSGGMKEKVGPSYIHLKLKNDPSRSCRVPRPSFVPKNP